MCEQLYSMELLIITVNQVIPVTQNMHDKNDSATVPITRSSDWLSILYKCTEIGQWHVISNSAKHEDYSYII